MKPTPDYYLTVTYPDGTQCGPTRLLGVCDRKEAKQAMKRKQKLYPDCTFELFEFPVGTDILHGNE